MRQIVVTEHFKKQLRSYRKKYRGIENDIIDALENFDERQADNLGANIYKLRLRVTGLTRGKSNSFRIIVQLIITHDLLVPITLYFKGDQETVDYAELEHHLKAIRKELPV